MTAYAFAVSAGGPKSPPVEFQVHAQGCADLARGVRSHKYSHFYTVEADTPFQAIAEEVAEYTANEQGYGFDDFQPMHCLTLTGGHTPAKIDTTPTTSPIQTDGPKGKTMATKTTQDCGCGCGEQVTRRFKPGHDARLKGAMLRLFRTGTAKDRQAAEHIATDNGWEHLLSASPNPKAKAPKAKGEAAERTGFNPVRVKIGRWAYDAILISEDTDSITVEYKGAGGGQPTRKTVKRSALVTD